MRHLRMVGLCLVAVFAIGAFAASSASALPEWGKCVAQAGGKYLDSNCTKKGSLKNPGSFEWKKGKELPNVKFSGNNVGAGGVLTTELQFCREGSKAAQRVPRAACEEGGGEEGPELGIINIECESEHNTGEQSGTNKVVNVSVKFRGCKVFGSAPCSNGTEEGEIQVNTLKGKLGYISKPSKEVGVLLEPEVKKHPFVQFICAGILGTVVGVGNAKEGAAYSPEKTGGYDGIISPITPVNTMTAEYTQVFTINEATQENIPSKFEGKHIELLEDYTYNVEEPVATSKWSKAGQTITNLNVGAEEGEIRA